SRRRPRAAVPGARGGAAPGRRTSGRTTGRRAGSRRLWRRSASNARHAHVGEHPPQVVDALEVEPEAVVVAVAHDAVAVDDDDRPARAADGLVRVVVAP